MITSIFSVTYMALNFDAFPDIFLSVLFVTELMNERNKGLIANQFNNKII